MAGEQLSADGKHVAAQSKHVRLQFSCIYDCTMSKGGGFILPTSLLIVDTCDCRLYTLILIYVAGAIMLLIAVSTGTCATCKQHAYDAQLQRHPLANLLMADATECSKSRHDNLANILQIARFSRQCQRLTNVLP